VKQLAPRLRVVTASAAESPRLSITFEPFYVIARELLPLFRQHWRELAVHKDVIPLDPNWDLMMQQSLNGVLHVLTVRDENKLVGYIFNIVAPHSHYKTTLHAYVDMFWLHPNYRRGLTGLKMFRENENYLRKLGAVRLLAGEKLHWHSKRQRQVRVLFRRLGLKAHEVMFSKLLVD